MNQIAHKDMKHLHLILALFVTMAMMSCSNDEEIPTPDPVKIESTLDLDVPENFEWSASLQGTIKVTLDNPLNVSTENEYVDLVNEFDQLIDRQIVKDNTAEFDIILPANTRHFVFFPETTDKIEVEGPGDYFMELGPVVPYIYNTSKSTTAVTSCTVCDSPIENAGGELPYYNSGYRIIHQDNVPGWKTTSPDKMIEVWVSGFGGVPSQEGRQFFELNANREAAMYQELCLEPGSTIKWSVWHRGRAGVDVAVVKIGATVETAEIQATMTDGKDAWGYYTGSYNVPAGQETTVFSFEAISTAASISVGNFLDNFEIECDFDGDGVIDRYDMFPEDPDKTTQTRFPDVGKQIVAFEDLWPGYGDFDFNDLVVSNVVEVAEAEGKPVSADFAISIDAIGASIDNGMGLIFYDQNKQKFAQNIIASVSEGVTIDPDNANGIIITEDIFETINDRYQNNGVGPVGVPDTVKFTVNFNANAEAFIPEIYLFRTGDHTYQVHRKEFPITENMNLSLFNTRDDAGNFTSASGLIWGMEIITEEHFKPAIETRDILLAYPLFEEWVTSNGSENQLWYMEPEITNVVDIEFGK
jgi:LruC domain-containing protein